MPTDYAPIKQPRRTSYTTQRLLLALLVCSLWVMVLLLGKVMPQVSAVILLLTFMVLYAWLLTVALVHRKRQEIKYPKALDTTYQPKVSVLVPAHNEETVIAKTVETLMQLDYPNFELWIIDDRSQDGTPFVLESLRQKYDDRYHYLIRAEGSLPGKSAVLNEALEHVDGEVICVFDADAYVDPNFLKNIVPFLADEGVGAAQARKVISNASTNLLTHCQNYEYSLDAHFQAGRDAVKGAVELRGNGQLVKRKALESVGGWNNYTVTDDLDLSTKLHLAGWDIRFCHKVLVFEEGITEVLPLLRQRRRWTEGNLSRYLENAGALLTSDKVSKRTTADMIAYFVEFLFPLWLVLDYMFVSLDIIGGSPNHIHLISSLFLLPLLSIFFASGLIVAILRFNKPQLHVAIAGALMTGLYMTFIWMPMVFLMMLKVLFQKERPLDWGKTAHFGAVAEPLSESI